MKFRKTNKNKATPKTKTEKKQINLKKRLELEELEKMLELEKQIEKEEKEREEETIGYEIVETLLQGDCFFDCLSIAFYTSGHIISIQQLRSYLPPFFTPEVFENYKSIHEYHPQLKKLFEEFPTYEKIKSKGLLSNIFWADEWVISVFENLFSIKIIVIDSETQNVVYSPLFSEIDPKKYIMVWNNEIHYKLITWRKKGLLTFEELPEEIIQKIIQTHLTTDGKLNKKSAFGNIIKFHEYLERNRNDSN